MASLRRAASESRVCLFVERTICWPPTRALNACRLWSNAKQQGGVWRKGSRDQFQRWAGTIRGAGEMRLRWRCRNCSSSWYPGSSGITIRSDRMNGQLSRLDRASGAKALVFQVPNVTAEAVTHKDFYSEDCL